MTESKRRSDSPEPTLRPRLSVCGALARELLTIINQLPPDVAELTCSPAAWYNHLEKIVPGPNAEVKAARKVGRTPVVIYGDCGTGGQLDAFIGEQNIRRVSGLNCYNSLMGGAGFDAAMDQELGTFFLTDYKVRYFEFIVMKGVGFAITLKFVIFISRITNCFCISRKPMTPFWSKNRGRRRQHCNWNMTIIIRTLVLTGRFFTICATSFSHLLVLVKQLLNNAIFNQGVFATWRI